MVVCLFCLNVCTLVMLCRGKMLQLSPLHLLKHPGRLQEAQTVLNPPKYKVRPDLHIFKRRFIFPNPSNILENIGYGKPHVEIICSSQHNPR